jgi:triosephosphate isomerase
MHLCGKSLIMRKNIAAGNWKMNNDLEAGKKLASEVVEMVNSELSNDAEVVLIPPFVHLTTVKNLIGSSKQISLGAQNCSDQDSGAFTGEISVSMLKSVGVKYVVIGHSERREYFNESDALLAEKVNKTLAAGLSPIFCCGESLETREADKHEGFVSDQIEASLFHLSAEELAKVVIAYEPIWAIGTGVTASSQQAQDMHKTIREKLASKYGQDVADSISILYGGSVKPDNAKEIFAQPDVDGGLVGGASLKSRDFTDIAKSF